MTIPRTQRALSLLLSLLLLFSLTPAALAAEGDDDTAPPAEATISLDRNSLAMNVGTPAMLKAIVTPDDGTVSVDWIIDNEEIIELSGSQFDKTVKALRPGEAKITATVGDKSAVCSVIVSGLYIPPGDNDENIKIEMFANESVNPPAVKAYGSAQSKDMTWKSSDPRIADYSANRFVAYQPGKVTFTAEANGYTADVEVTVLSSDAEPIEERASAGNPLSFTNMQDKINNCCVEVTKGRLLSVTGLSVAPKEGVLYLNYKSEAEPGAGVAQMQTYYITGGTSKGPYIRDITFVPNPNFSGTATIRYTGQSDNNGRSFSGVIKVDIDNATANMTLEATAKDPAKFTAQLFSRVCQSKLGESIKEVVFALPPETRGTLYLDYSSTSDYGSKVETGRRYRYSELDRISFVPAAGFAGTATLYYTGYGVGGGSYQGEITITVTQETTEGPVYNTAKNSAVTFDGGDFDDYCDAQTGQVLRCVQFTLPDARYGTLYYDYRSSTQQGTPVQAGVNYYLSQNPRISHVAFVPANEFTGRVTIPFTGWDAKGNRFVGTAEVNVRASGGSGDVYYTCSPGRSVKLDNDDFNDLSIDLTGDRLYSITFNSLPSTGDGALYHSRTSSSSGTRVKTKVEYFNSRSPRIDNLSFWATNSFSGAVEVPFTAYTVNDESFSGTMVIDSRSGGSSGRPEIEYDTDYREAVTFAARDFDDLCIYETDDDLNYVRFTQPSSSVGTLYYNYRSSSSTGSKVSSSTSYYYSGSGNTISKVSFVPANSFNGTAEIDFTGYAKDGTRFNGTVVVNVGEATPEARVIYTTRQAPVNLQASAFENANSRVRLRSVRFAYMPSSAAGRLYFQYTSPTVYGWQATANTEYQISGSPALSSLTFVPKAGYTGTVTIPYTATATNGSQYGGELIIYVEGGGYSTYFSDMGSYPAEAQSAVDYLKEQGVVSGITATTYGPELSIRRGDFALMLVRAFKLTAGGGTGQRFSDVPATAYYADAVQTLRALGIVSGTGGNLYQPTSTLSRQDAMLMVQRAMRISGYSAGDGPSYVLSSYSDSGSVSSYAQGAMAYVVQQGLLPTTGNRLAPRDALSRVDMAVLLHRAMTM